jgi:prepilin-type N-terminal cleavage/methylation domain-containing protein
LVSANLQLAISRGSAQERVWVEIANCKNKQIKGVNYMTKNKKGFTIIEVVLVLAIAGLIFLMVFIALPALQRGQRNTQRRDDMARVLTKFNEYQSSNNGNYPFKLKNGKVDIDHNFVKKYMDNGCTNKTITASTEDTDCGSEFKDPDGRNYYFVYTTKNNNAATKGKTEDTDITSAIGTDAAVDHRIHVYTNAKCGEKEGSIRQGTGIRNIAILYRLEGGSVYCGDNS